MIQNPKLIMIDLDGTLIDSVPDLAYCVDEMMQQIGREPWGQDAVRNWVGNGVERLVHRALTNTLEEDAPTTEFDQAYPLFLNLYATNTSGRSALYKGVIETLPIFAKAQGHLGCVTNKAAQFTEPLLKEKQIDSFFEVIISGDTLPKKKPDPLPLLHAAEHFNVKPQDCLMLGDSQSDVKAARAAGFGIICMSYGYNHGIDIRDMNPDAVVDSMTEIPALIYSK